jgi:hypothetical protein
MDDKRKKAKKKAQNKAYLGHELLSNEAAMTGKMYGRILLLSALAQVVILAAAWMLNKHEAAWLWHFARAHFVALGASKMMTVPTDTGAMQTVPAEVVLDAGKQFAAGYASTLLTWLAWSFAVYPLGLITGGVVCKVRAAEALAGEHERGTEVVEAEEIAGEMRAKNVPRRLPFGQLLQPVALENRHTLVVAQQGWGKTLVELARMKTIRVSGGRAVVYCYKVDDLFRRFYDSAKDFVFAPLDARCCGFNIFNSVNATDPIRAKIDIRAIAASLVPTPADAGQNAWCYGNAADVFAALMWLCWLAGERTNKAVWELIRRAGNDLKGVLEALKTTEGCEAAYSHLTHEKTASTVLSTLNTSAQAFEFLAEVDGDFSVETWMKTEGGSVLWVLNPEESKAVMKDMLTLFIDLTIRALAALPDDCNRRRYFLLGELGTLHRLSSIDTLLTECRSKGGCADLSFQSLPQLTAIYGERTAEHLIGQCSSKLIGRCGDNKTSEYFARNIGEAHTVERSEAQTWGVGSGRDGGSIHESKRRELAVLAEEIRQLPDREGLVYLQGYRWARTAVPLVDFPVKHPAFVPRPATERSTAATAKNNEAEGLDFD